MSKFQVQRGRSADKAVISDVPRGHYFKHGQSNDLRGILGSIQHENLLRNYQLSSMPRDIYTVSKHKHDIEFVVTRSTSMVHVINLCETIDDNLERILLEQRYSAEEATKLTSSYTFRLYTNELIFDARDMQEILELSRVIPETFNLKMYKYTPEEYKERQDLEKQRAE